MSKEKTIVYRPVRLTSYELKSSYVQGCKSHALNMHDAANNLLEIASKLANDGNIDNLDRACVEKVIKQLVNLVEERCV